MNPSEPDRMKGSTSPSEETKMSPKGGVNHASPHDMKSRRGVNGEMMKSSLMFTQHYLVSFSVASITLLSIGIFGYGGYALDETYRTFPLFFIFGIIISFPVSLYGIYTWVQRRYIPHLKKLK